MSSYRQPDFLTEKDEPIYRIRCPIHGFIHFSENERQIIDHGLFRRLRYIRQLALTELIYPGATHTRFEHSLGVMEVATRAFDSLAAKRGDLLESVFKAVSGFEDKPMAQARQFLRLSALLHDVGHSSFSHAAEKVTHSGLGHEVLSIKIVKEPDLLGRKLNQLFGGGECAEWVSQILEGPPQLPPQLQILRDLVSGEMDSDRTDYLLRDSYHCGVDYGRFDHRRMLECLEVREGSMSGLEIALGRDGLHTFEALILARYQMNTQVYYHRLRRIYDLYLINYFKSLGEEAPDAPDKVIADNDMTMMARIWEDAENGEGDSRKWAKRIKDREHHRVVHETGVNAEEPDLSRSREVFSELQKDFPDCDFQWDVGAGSIHKLLTPEDEAYGNEACQHLVKIDLVGPDMHTQNIGGASQVLSKIPHDFRCARIFAALSPDQKEERKEIKDCANRKWKEKGGNQ